MLAGNVTAGISARSSLPSFLPDIPGSRDIPGSFPNPGIQAVFPVSRCFPLAAAGPGSPIPGGNHRSFPAFHRLWIHLQAQEFPLKPFQEQLLPAAHGKGRAVELSWRSLELLPVFPFPGFFSPSAFHIKGRYSLRADISHPWISLDASTQFLRILLLKFPSSVGSAEFLPLENSTKPPGIKFLLYFHVVFFSFSKG